MKNLLYILALLFVTNTSNAQTNYTPTGTWKWINGGDSIIIYFKTDQFILDNVTYPIIIGFHKYVKNGILIENTLNSTNSTFSNNQYSIATFGDLSNNRIDGDIKDITLNNKRYIILTKINPTTINVTLNYIQGVRNNRPYGFTMPRHFTLIKQ